MSKPRRIGDAERTATMLDLLHQRYVDPAAASLSHVFVQEVAPGTGFMGPNRYADVLVLGVWRDDPTLRGFEVKASRADLLRELADPSKHRAVARYCDRWTLVAWDESVLPDNWPNAIPAEWGVTITVDGAHGRELKEIRKAPPRTPDPWPRSFVCSMVRNAYEQAPGAAYVARAVVTAGAHANLEYTRITDQRLRELVRPLTRIIFGKDEWRWPSETKSPDGVVKVAVERLTQGVLPLPSSLPSPSPATPRGTEGGEAV